ncbi:MAG: zinc dependent phospholipase C family protein [Cyclobacteriaceae bacterium]
MKKTLLLALLSLSVAGFRPIWGFFAHQKINRLAVFTLPGGMIGFYKNNIGYITRAAVNPDRRRYALAEEASRHFLDVDHYGDSALAVLPHDWREAAARYGEDSLRAHGILPWHLYRMYFRLRDAFMVRDPDEILKVSAELGHYIGDAHVPLHTTENYNGQLTGQEGIHGFWESRLPEVFSGDYNFFVGRAQYISDIRKACWQVIASTHEQVARVLAEEKKLALRYEEKKYSFETRGNETVKVYAIEYARDYHRRLEGMVEKQMRASIKMTGDFWFTAWVDAGQPDLKKLIDHKPGKEELEENREALREWKTKRLKVREHE